MRGLIQSKKLTVGDILAPTSTVERIQMDGFIWSSIVADVENFISKCMRCHKHNTFKRISAPALALPIKGSSDRIGIDLVFGLPVTTDGYKGILVITEYLTKFPYAVPIRSKTADEIAAKLWVYFSIFGPSRQIISDNGPEFINQVVERLLSFCGVERRITSAYSPHVNGLTEKFNHTLVRSLSKHASENPKDWPNWIPFVLLAYRTRVNTTTGYTPFFLTFGRECNQFAPFDNQEVEEQLAISQRAIELERLKRITIVNALDNVNTAQEKQKQIQNSQTNVDYTDLEPGSYVYIEGKPIKGKLEPKCNGPYVVYRKNSSCNYRIHTKDGKRIGTYPRFKLKSVPGVNEPITNFRVEKILDCRGKDGSVEYLVKWLNEPENNNSWVKEAHIDNLEGIQNFNFDNNVTVEVNYG